MTIARRGLKVKVMGKANAVGSTSIEGCFFHFVEYHTNLHVLGSCTSRQIAFLDFVNGQLSVVINMCVSS